MLAECSSQPIDEFASEHSAQDFDRQEEGIAGADPARVVWRKTARRDHTMDMRMDLKSLPPRVQHTDEADLGSKMFFIGGNLKQSR